MTVRAPGTLAGAAPAALEAQGELRTACGVVLGGSLNGDVIIASAEAAAIVKAGLFVRALVIAGMELLQRTVSTSGGGRVRLEFGVYRAVS